MYVGITRAQRTLAVSWTKRRKKGREMVPPCPAASSRKWAWTPPPREDPREKLRQLRAESRSRHSSPRPPTPDSPKDTACVFTAPFSAWRWWP
jgi:ATP-dependent DNA helicase Rep